MVVNQKWLYVLYSEQIKGDASIRGYRLVEEIDNKQINI